MYPHPTRRRFMKSVLAAAAGMGLGRAALARSKDAVAITPTRINDHVVVFSGAGANVVAAHRGDDILLVDGGLPERSADLLAAVYRETRAKRVQTLINSHWHPEQTGSNERLGKTGARIIAHENTRRWLGYAQTEPGQDHPYGPLPPKARPTETLVSSINLAKATLEFGGEKVEYGYLLQAHTDGDLYVFFRDS